MSGRHRRSAQSRTPGQDRSDLEWVFLALVVVALLTYFVVGPLFEDLFHVIKERQGSGRLSLVVSAASVVALVLAGVNTYRVLRGGADKALRIEFSEGVLRFFLGIAALAIGMIIGRTIFT